MLESLIPFGLDEASGQLVDVGSIKRGKACGCVCPSCYTPLVARHGQKKEWHFAHRSQKVHDQTRKGCEYSFAVSVRLMIRQLSNGGLQFKTPRLEYTLPTVSDDSYEFADFGYCVTNESDLKLVDVKVGVPFCGVTVDVLGYVQGVPFVVYVTYKDRKIPVELKDPSITKCGVVELNINAVPALFKQVEKGQYKEVLRRYIEEKADGKVWVYHPRERRLRMAALQKRQLWLRQQKIEPIPKKSSYGMRTPGQSLVSGRSKEDGMLYDQRAGKYKCVICRNEWEGTSRICTKCNTHLYTVERE